LVSTQALNRSMATAARQAVAPVGGTADLSLANGTSGVARALAADVRAVPGLRAVVPLVAERVVLTDLDGRLALLLGVERRDAVRRAVEAVVAGRALVQTPDAGGQSVEDVIAGVQTGFALCGAGALVVGLFLVYNALAVSVAERRSEIGVLRSLGATRGQVAA